jgi:hypothetical protein
MSGHKPKKGLHLDVPTRWNSTYTMLEEAVRYKAALTSYADVQNIQGPTVEDWNLAKRVCNFLKNFADATKVFSMHKFPTSHRYLEEIWGIRGILVDEKYTKDEYYEHYEHMAESSSRRFNINSSPEVGGSADMLPRLMGKRKLELGFALFKQQHRPNRRRRSEVDMYLEDALVPLREDERFDVLEWLFLYHPWLRNRHSVPQA